VGSHGRAGAEAHHTDRRRGRLRAINHLRGGGGGFVQHELAAAGLLARLQAEPSSFYRHPLGACRVATRASEAAMEMGRGASRRSGGG
jgi:hypothetical protein